VLGGISPFGQRTRHRIVLDAGALDADRIVVSGGKRGFDVSLKPQDLIAVLDAVTAPLSTW
jgi:Cys-tRNA(Pro)/Cys-tRNA(Cys) deacylase